MHRKKSLIVWRMLVTLGLVTGFSPNPVFCLGWVHKIVWLSSGWKESQDQVRANVLCIRRVLIVTGKSYVCSQIVRYLQEKGKVTCAYYFCNHRMLGKDTVSNVLRTLAVYILRENLDLVPFVHEGYYVKGCGRSAISLKKMLKEIMTLVFCVRIVIDGFDECDEAVQKELLGALTDVQNATGQSCKLLIASRPDHSTNRKEKIRLHEETVNAIQTYIRTEVRVLRETWEVISEDLGRLIEEHLTAKANGMLSQISSFKLFYRSTGVCPQFWVFISQTTL
jgi:hypothetical protein